MHFILPSPFPFPRWIKKPLLAPSMAKKIGFSSLAQMADDDRRWIPIRVVMHTNRIQTESIFSRRLSQVIILTDNNDIFFSFYVYFLKLALFRCLHDSEIIIHSIIITTTCSGQSSWCSSYCFQSTYNNASELWKVFCKKLFEQNSWLHDHDYEIHCIPLLYCEKDGCGGDRVKKFRNNEEQY